MTPAEYYDWWFYSGICPGMPTRPVNHAVLRERLSAAGVHLVVLWELLLDNADLDNDASYILPLHISGSHDRISAAAREVGALRLAEDLASRPGSTVVPETRRELKRLLKRFAARHDAELALDVARHGDPRTAPDFDKRTARRKRDELWSENTARYQIADRIPFFAAPIMELRAFLSQGLALAEISTRNEEMAGLAGHIQYDFPRWSEAPQPPEVKEFLDECRRLTEQHPRQLPAWGSAWKAINDQTSKPKPAAPAVSKDRKVLFQLYRIGPYQAEQIGPMTILTWDSVPALDDRLAPTGLRFTYPGKFPVRLLTDWPEAQRRFTAALPRMTEALLASARAQVTDDELRPPDEELLARVRRGMLSVSVQDDEPRWSLECSWEVEWDPEHGCRFGIDDDGGVVRVE